MILKDIRVVRNIDIDTSGYVRFGQDTGTANWRLGAVSGGNLTFYNSTSSPATILGQQCLCWPTPPGMQH